MKTKQKILALLEQNKGDFLSGEQMGQKLHLSRNAIWKAIHALQTDGYKIEAITKKGYKLLPENDILSPEGIQYYLPSSLKTNPIFVYKTLESTNKTAKELAVQGAKHGTVILAEEQTKGKGRFGRTFYSPSGSGLYLSLILRPDTLNLANISLITIYTAVIVCRAIEKIYHISPKIKWINDILLDGKKAGGILTEGVTDFESNTLEWIVVGIGLNISTTQEMFPPALQDIATSIGSPSVLSGKRNALAGEIISAILALHQEDFSLFSEYKKRLSLLRHRIQLTHQNKVLEGIAFDLNPLGHLLVKTDNGEILTLLSSETSIQIIS